MRAATAALVIAGALAPSTLCAQSPGMLAGCWSGRIAEGPSQRPAVLELRSTGPGYGGTLTVLGRTAKGQPIEGAAAVGDTVVFQTTRGSAAELRTVLAADRTTMTGRLISDDDTVALRFARIPESPRPDEVLVGSWGGVLDAGFPMRILLRFRPAPCGQLHMTMDSPDQNAVDLPATALALAGDSLRFEMAYMDGGFSGTIERATGVIAGTWTQRGMMMPLRVERSDSVAWHRPQDPKPPYPYRTEDVAYDNAAGGVRLAGTLTLPSGDGPFPAVLLVSGSGPQDRDESIAGHRPFLVIADHLARNGIAVLRVDDRGVGGSTGNVLAATIDDYAGDALAGIAYLRGRSDIDPRQIGLLGHSEGGYVAPLAASGSDDVAFVVMLAGPAVSGRALLAAQREALTRAAGEAPEVRAARNVATEAAFDVLVREPVDSAARAGIIEAFAALRAAGDARRTEVLDSLYGSAGEASLDVMLTPWFRYLLTYDPAPALRALRVPLLALFGALDLQVPADQSVLALDQLRATTRSSSMAVRVFPRLNHLFQTATTGLPEEYIRIDETIAPVVLHTITDWIVERSR